MVVPARYTCEQDEAGVFTYEVKEKLYAQCAAGVWEDMAHGSAW